MQFVRAWAVAIAAALFLALGMMTSLAGAAQDNSARQDYTPIVGQQGKDVIWVPTPHALVERMLQMANVRPGDYVVDLGSGDGRTVIAAAKEFGARALGLEYNPDMVAFSRRNAQKAGVADRAQFKQADIFATDFSNATVVTMYLLPTLNLKLRPTLLKMKPGTRIVSHAFAMGDWKPDRIEHMEGLVAYLWIVPASVDGKWRIEVSGGNGGRYDLTLRQRFQELEGEAQAGVEAWTLRDAHVRGDEVMFSLTNGNAVREFAGRLDAARLEGTVGEGGSEAKWTAARMQ